MIQNENYITIQGFMVNELQLKGNELIVYAIIYGFSQINNQRFTGSLKYLMGWINGTKQTVINTLNSLMEKQFIDKEEKVVNNIKYCSYGVVKNLDQGGLKIRRRWSKF